MTFQLRQQNFDGIEALGIDLRLGQNAGDDRDRRRQVLQSLTRSHYSSALQIGCGEGFLGPDLARRADRFLALDPSEIAVRQARKLLIARSHACARQASAPTHWPGRIFDLIVISDLGQHPAQDLRPLARRCAASLSEGGEIVLLSQQGGLLAEAGIFRSELAKTRLIKVTQNRNVPGHLHMTFRVGGMVEAHMDDALCKAVA